MALIFSRQSLTQTLHHLGLGFSDFLSTIQITHLDLALATDIHSSSLSDLPVGLASTDASPVYPAYRDHHGSLSDVANEKSSYSAQAILQSVPVQASL